MISLNDVLLAMSNIPVDDPIAEIWGRGLQGGYKIIDYIGPLPITITADGSALIDYRIYGNTVQDGTPTPENPVDVVGCGERTENLFNSSMIFESGYINDSGIITEVNNMVHTRDYIPIKNSSQYVLTGKLVPEKIVASVAMYDAQKNFITRHVGSPGQNEIVFTTAVNCSYVRFNVNDGYADFHYDPKTIMLTEGSTAPKSYIPYGYKLPMTVSDGNTVQTVPIYLGEVETTRRIKKLVFDGTESWAYDSINTRFSSLLRGMDYEGARTTTFICSHYEVIDDGRIITNVPNNTAYAGGTVASPLCYIKTNEYSNLEEFKSYLAAQYAAGTPVTVWYVLAEPETGIVNEPLMKIGDYADALSMEQADVQIPTFAGTTVIDYDGEPKPGKMYVKYRR